MPLTPKQQRFVDEYLIDLNAAAAARRAGYSERTAKQQGSRLLTNVDVQAEVARRAGERAQAAAIDARDVLQEYSRVAFSDIGGILDFTGDEPNLLPVREISEAARRTLSSVKVRRYTEGRGEDAREVEVTEFKLWDKIAALRDLGRHLKLFTDLVQFEGLDAAIERELARLAGRGQSENAGQPQGQAHASEQSGSSPVDPAAGAADGGLPQPGG